MSANPVEVQRRMSWWRLRFDVRWFVRAPGRTSWRHLADSMKNVVSLHRAPAWNPQPVDPDVIVGLGALLAFVFYVVVVL